MTEVGVNVKAESVIVLAGGGVTVRLTLRLPSWLFETLMLAVCVEVMLFVLALNLTLELPAGIRTVEGTVTAAVLLLETAS